MMDWGRCTRCWKYAFLPHNCKAFECALEPAEDCDWHEIYSLDAERAVEAFADLYDSGGDYTIIKQGDRGETIVIVREPHSDAKPLRFHVIGETVPHYSARKLPADSAPTQSMPGTVEEVS